MTPEIDGLHLAIANLLTRVDALEDRVHDLEAQVEMRAQNHEETFASIERSLAILFGDRP